MNYFDEHPNLYRILIGLLTTYLMAIAAVNFYRYAKSPTDENWFRNSPSVVYVVKEIPTDDPKQRILIGDLITEINKKPVYQAADYYQVLKSLPLAQSVPIKIHRLPTDKEITIRVATLSIPDLAIWETPITAYVYDVIEGGASDRAGMKKGDLIFEINGKTFKNATDADLILRRAQIGKTIDYDVIRDHQELTLQVTLAQFGIPIPTLIFILCGLVYFIVGGYIAFSRPQIKAARLVGLGMLLVGFFFLVILNQRDIEVDLLVALRGPTLLLSFYLGVAVWIHSGYYFPTERTDQLEKRWLRYIPYGIAILWIILVSYYIVTKKPLGNPGVFGGLFLIILYSIGVNLRYRKTRPPEHKKLSRIISWSGVIFGSIGFALTLYLINKNQQIKLGFIGIPLAFIPISYLYTIGRYHLLDLDLRIRKNIQYSFVSMIWTLFIIFGLLRVLIELPRIQIPLPNIRFTGNSIEVTREALDPEHRIILEKIVLMFHGIVLSFLVWKLYGLGKGMIDKRFYRLKYDYRRAANELGQVMSTNLSMVDLAKGIVEKLSQLMQLKKAGIVFFRDEEVCCCREAYQFDLTKWEELCIYFDQNFISSIQLFRNDISIDYLPDQFKKVFRDTGIRFIVPIRSKEKLIGTLLVGEKLSEATFQQEDLEFLNATAIQASVSIENAFLYENLAEQERLKHELEIARRIQMESLPQETPEIRGLDISGISIPAMEVGGDYYDYLNGGSNQLTVIVGDVSGKGTSAALYMSKVQGILRSLHGFNLSPRELFIRANLLLRHSMERKSFVTAIGADFLAAENKIIMARAGHLPMYFYQSGNQQVDRIIPKGLGLGLEEEGVFESELEEINFHYRKGDIFLFVTDGVTEARNATGQEFGDEPLLEILRRNAHLPAADLRDKVITEVQTFAQNTMQHDDLTVVAVKVII